VTKGGRVIEIRGPADITREDTEAIVNAANSSLLGGGGVDGAIHRAGGAEILEDCRRYVAEHGRLPAGKAMITSAGQLPARYVIHTVGPIYRDGESGEAEVLASCHRECVRLAGDHKVRSLAFPAISTGAYGYPVQRAAEVAISSVLDEIDNVEHLHLVRFVLFDSAACTAYAKAAERSLVHRQGLRIDRKPES
jgi:O-acetyl-ADP-ribose deacetylase (regulator of RNase III)